MALPVRALVLQKIGNLHWKSRSFVLAVHSPLPRNQVVLRVAVSACSFPVLLPATTRCNFAVRPPFTSHPMEGALGYRVFCSVHRA